MATVLCSFSIVSQTWVSGMGMSRKFRMRCKMVVLLGNRFFAVANRCAAAMEESVYDSACVKQVFDETERGVLFR